MIIGLMHEGNKISANVHTSSLKNIYEYLYVFLSMILKHLISHSLPSFFEIEWIQVCFSLYKKIKTSTYDEKKNKTSKNWA